MTEIHILPARLAGVDQIARLSANLAAAQERGADLGSRVAHSPRELALRFTDGRRYFVSEATVYRLLKAQDLITSPAYIVVKAADEFRDKATAPNQL